MKTNTLYLLAEIVCIVAAVLSFAAHQPDVATFLMAFAIYYRINRGDSK